jgi:hypothetical protein
LFAIEGGNQPLADVAIEVQDEIADAVGSDVGTPPDLLFAERFDAGAEAGPVVLKQFVAGEFEEELGDIGRGVGH